ncbi:MAG: ABC transporter permease [Acidilobaceae archaeon]
MNTRVARALAFRAVTLLITLFLIVVLTAVIVVGTGYDRIILEAQVKMEVQAYLQDKRSKGIEVSPEEIKQLEEHYRKVYGLDAPLWERITKLITNTLVLDLYIAQSSVADSVGLMPPAKVSEAIKVALPRTIIMITLAYILASVIAIPLGALLAYRRGGFTDKVVISYAAFTNAFPVWWIAMVAIIVFSYRLGIAPTNFRYVIHYLNQLGEAIASMDLWASYLALKEILYYAYLPILVVLFGILGSWIYAARAITLRVVTEDFVNTARAKGLSERLILWRYVVRVAIGPVLTLVILGLAGSISGYLITEVVFDWPGMGSLTNVAISLGDAPTILGIVYVTSAVYIAARFLLEVLYVILDPRVRF